MSHYLTPQEWNLVKTDYANLLAAYEACTLTVKYRKFSSGTGNVDAVYKYSDGAIAGDEVTVLVSAIHKIVKEEDLDIIAFGILQVGDSIFFVAKDIDFNKPNGTDDAVPDTLLILDTSGIEWIPRLKESEQLSKHLMTHIGDDQYAQVIPASLRKNTKPQ